jgi:hypothetical protein
MPTYTFRDIQTDEHFEDFMSISDKEKFLEQNPHIEQTFTTVRLGDSVRLGITKPPADFMKGVVQRIEKAVPGNNLKSSKKFQIPREW